MIWVANWPEPMTQSDAGYRDWLKTVGSARNQSLSSYYILTQVEPRGGDVWPEFAERRFRAWYRPFDVRGEVAGFSEAQHFGAITFDAEGRPQRESRSDAWLRFDRVERGETLVLRATPDPAAPDVNLRAVRAADPSELDFMGLPIPFDAAAREYRITAPPGEEPLWISWQVPESSKQGLLLHWVGIDSERGSGIALGD